jgi:hypothetical protein
MRNEMTFLWMSVPNDLNVDAASAVIKRSGLPGGLSGRGG